MKFATARNLFSALAIALAGTALASAQGPGGMGMAQGFDSHRPPMERAFRQDGRDGRWWNNPHMIERLKLTNDQRKAMDEIMLKHRENLIDLHADLERAELAMQPLMSADQPDQAAMEAQIDKIVAARAALEKADAHFLLDIRMKLTADQWKQLRDLRANMMARPRVRSGPGAERQWRQGPGGPPPPQGNPPAQPPAPQGEQRVAGFGVTFF